MRNFLDIKRLRYFREIAEQGSMSAAARALNVAQPALSHHVSALESQLGLVLLDRRHDGVAVTEAGRLLLRHAVDITTRIERAEADLERFARGPRGRTKIRLAVISSLAADLTPLLVAGFARDLPEIALRITESPTVDSRDLLGRGEADLAIYLAAEPPEEGLLARERLYLVTAAVGSSAPVAFADVARQKLVMPATGNPLRTLVEATATAAGLVLDIALEVDGAVPRRNAVAAGLGATIFGAHAALEKDAAALAARPIVAPALYRPVCFGARRGLDPMLVGRSRDIVAAALAGIDGMEVALDSATVTDRLPSG